MTVSNLIFAAAGAGSKYGGKTITYSIGSGGTSVIFNTSGNAGQNTSATFEGVTITGNGGGGASYVSGVDNYTAATGGTYSGGDGGSNGGNGGVYAAWFSSGSGGAIGNVNGLSSTSSQTGATGAQSNNSNLSGLQTAIEACGYSWTSPGQGYSTTTTAVNATGFGCGGGSIPRTTQTDGGNGYLGGGSGSFSKDTSGTKYNGAGGGGAVVCQFVGSTTTYVVLTTGTSYTVPNGTNSVKIWVVGAGGSGSCNIQYNIGKGGAAGGVAWKTWS